MIISGILIATSQNTDLDSPEGKQINDKIKSYIKSSTSFHN